MVLVRWRSCGFGDEVVVTELRVGGSGEALVVGRTGGCEVVGLRGCGVVKLWCCEVEGRLLFPRSRKALFR